MDEKNVFTTIIMHMVQHYNPKKYWKMRSIVVDPLSATPRILKYVMYYRIKRMDAFNNASMGTAFGGGAQFAEPPILWHGLNGIIVSHYASIGKNCIICQQVTIAGGSLRERVIIGDNVMIGSWAKIIGPCKIGNNVKIGANAVVAKNIPDNCTVVGTMRIIQHESL